MMYIPLAQMPDLETALNSRVAPLWWFVRSEVDPHTLVASISDKLRDASAGLPVAHIRTMEEIESKNIARQRLNMLLLTVYGMLLLPGAGAAEPPNRPDPPTPTPTPTPTPSAAPAPAPSAGSVDRSAVTPAGA